ncbi:MAG: HAD family hydrolase [Flavobacteriaceae bacterium]|nr:HAD family hydrolase [Flavobacteriaceae bacterium]
MKKYKCVIFDCDGVLVDSEPLANGMLVEMANELGLEIDLDYAYKKFKGDSFKNCQNHIQSLLGKPLPKNFEEEFKRRSFDSFTKNLKAIEGIESIIKNLKVPFCVTSSGPQNKIKHNLKLTGLFHYFEGRTFGCHDIQKWKPEPDIFIHAAKTMGFSVDDCIVIEDTPIGINAAKSGEFDVFGFADDNTFDLFKKETTAVFRNTSELKELFNIHLK